MKKTILLVDDDPLFLDLLTGVLTQQSWLVLTAENGSEALKLLKGCAVDAIVSDIEMPVMNGITLHAQLQYNAELKAIPFVFLSGSENPEFIDYARRQANVSFVGKTQVPDRLLSLLFDFFMP